MGIISDYLKQVQPATQPVGTAAQTSANAATNPAPYDNSNANTPAQITAGLQNQVTNAVGTTPWFDPQYEAVVNAVNRNRGLLTSQRATAENRVGEDYGTNVEAAGKQNTTNLNALQQKLMNSGLTYSGVNVAEQGRLGEAYQDTLNKLNTWKSRSLEDIATDAANQEAGFLNTIGQAQADSAARHTAWEENQAFQQAQNTAAQNAGDQSREWMNQLTQTLTQLSQPQATPTGQLNPAGDANSIVQQALQQVPPPKTPQQQLADIGVNPVDLQKHLQLLGFNPGPIDGVMGKKTQLALALWKQSIGLPATGDIDEDIWNRLLGSGTGTTISPSGNIGRAVPTSGASKAVL